MEALKPCRTIYVRNLPDKLSKPRLRTYLHALFSPYGHVEEIIAEKTSVLRGQAFITYEHQSSATVAVRKLHSSLFYGRNMSVTYAKQVSDRLARTEEKNPQNKRRRTNQANGNHIKSEFEGGKPIPDEAPPNINGNVNPPNCILLVEGLPETLSNPEDRKSMKMENLVTDIFARFAGFEEVRWVPGSRGIAFVEYDNVQNAAIAMSGAQGERVESSSIRVSYAKR